MFCYNLTKLSNFSVLNDTAACNDFLVLYYQYKYLYKKINVRSIGVYFSISTYACIILWVTLFTEFKNRIHILLIWTLDDHLANNFDMV